MKIKKVSVIGAGVMGAGIAAQIANSGYEVIFLNIPSKNNDRNANITAALVKMSQGKTPALTHPKRQKFIKIGNIEDDLKLLNDCDLIIEAIVEKLEVKHELYQKIIPHLKTGAIIASNTSTLPLAELKSKLPIDTQNHFLIIHFFNPPKAMELVELVTDQHTDEKVKQVVTEFVTRSLGKTTINCQDSPGFVANRLGCYLLEMIVRRAIEQNFKPNIIDQIFTNLFGLPSTGIFGLYDLIGLDVMQLISNSLVASLPEDDDYHKIFTECFALEKMLAKNLLGRKTKGGFYRIVEIAKKKQTEMIDFRDLSYQPCLSPAVIFDNIDQLLNSDDQYAIFIKQVLIDFYSYIFTISAQITDNLNNIDLAMELGYSWKYGPFKLLEQMPQLAEFLQKKLENFCFNRNVKNDTKTIKNNETIIFSNDEAQLLSYQNRLVFTPTTKMNCLTPQIFELLQKSINYAEQKSLNLYIAPQGNNFSVGADLKYIAHLIENKNFIALDNFLSLGQQTLQALKYAQVPIIACASGFALGGGTEILLHANNLLLNYELRAGLVETSLGLIPAFGGLKECLLRGQDNSEVLINNISNILNANKSSSADYFVEDYNINNYHLNMNKHYLLAEAFALDIKATYLTKSPLAKINFPKVDLMQALAKDEHDPWQKELLIWLQQIINQSNLTENELLAYERQKFIELSKRPSMLEQINSKL